MCTLIVSTGSGLSPASISANCSGESFVHVPSCIWCQAEGRGIELPVQIMRVRSCLRTSLANSRKAVRTISCVRMSRSLRVAGVPSCGTMGGRCSFAFGRSASRLYSLPNSQPQMAGESRYRVTTSRVYVRMNSCVLLAGLPHWSHGSPTRSGTVGRYQNRLGIRPTPCLWAERTTPSSSLKYLALSSRYSFISAGQKPVHMNRAKGIPFSARTRNPAS